MEEERVVAIVQARLGSVRFPRKVLQEVLGQPLLAHLLERLGRSSLVDEIVLAVPDSPANDALADFARERGVTCSRGSEHDVLDRYYRAAEAAGASIVVRITGDCPLTDPAIVDQAVGKLRSEHLDDVRTTERYPNGFDVEALTMAALRRAWEQAVEPYDREHVTPYVVKDPENTLGVLDHDDDIPNERVTLDEPEDFTVIAAVFDAFGHNRFTLADVADLMRRQPELFAANRAFIRNEGSVMGTGAKLWRRAQRVIPGGNRMRAKRPETFAASGWPTYFSRAQGCRLWDLDGNEFLDVGLMGLGANILGYGYPSVDEAVRRVIDIGNLSTLNAPEEVTLAEQLVALHPWADMACFTRGDGEALEVATQIARAASGRDGVTVCGGHDLGALEAALAGGDIGVVCMEMQSAVEQGPGALERVRSLATRHHAVLVLDERMSGFRKVLGGLHLHLGLEPDVAVFSNVLGNGYAISAVIGREAVMNAAQETILSSTFSERIGPVAALATIDAMRVEDAPTRVDAIGAAVRERWIDVAAATGLAIEITGVPALGAFTVKGVDPAAVEMFVTTKMLEHQMLAGTHLYASIAHDDPVLDTYFERLEPVLQTLATCDTTEAVLALLS